MIDLVLGDDHAVFADALSAVLTRDGFDVTAVAHGLRDTIEAVARHQPDVCLLDRCFADGDGIDAVGDLLDAGPRTRVLFLTADQSAEDAARAVRAGASGYVNKMCEVGTVRAAIRAVLGGEIVLDLSTRRFRRPEELTDVHRLAAHLTGRERECLALLVAGAGTGVMVRRMGVSATTVRTHVQSLLTKLGVHSRLEAASLAVRYSLLDEIPARASNSG